MLRTFQRQRRVNAYFSSGVAVSAPCCCSLLGADHQSRFSALTFCRTTAPSSSATLPALRNHGWGTMPAESFVTVILISLAACAHIVHGVARSLDLLLSLCPLALNHASRSQRTPFSRAHPASCHLLNNEGSIITQGVALHFTLLAACRRARAGGDAEVCVQL